MEHGCPEARLLRVGRCGVVVLCGLLWLLPALVAGSAAATPAAAPEPLAFWRFQCASHQHPQQPPSDPVPGL